MKGRAEEVVNRLKVLKMYAFVFRKRFPIYSTNVDTYTGTQERRVISFDCAVTAL